MCWRRKKPNNEESAPKSSTNIAMDTNCPGCGKHLKDIKAWEKHARRCEKLGEVLRNYNTPTVSVQELPYLEIKPLSQNGEEWGIWNAKQNDWVRDQNGQIDSRLFQRNVKTFLNSLTAKSILYGVKNNLD